MKLKTRVLAAMIGLGLAMTAGTVAHANPVYFSGSGTWDANTLTTAYSQANATWQFSFQLPDTIASNPTTQVTNFVYSLNGSVVATSLPGGVLFFSVTDGGGFDLFPPPDNASGVADLSLLFPYDVGTSLHLVGGTFSSSLLLNDGDLPGSGAGTVNIVPSPEPPSILLLGTALLLGAGFITVRRRMMAEIAE